MKCEVVQADLWERRPLADDILSSYMSRFEQVNLNLDQFQTAYRRLLEAVIIVQG